MKTTSEITGARKTEFAEEFQELLKRHNVDLHLTDDEGGWNSATPVLEFKFSSIDDEYNNVTYEAFDVNLNDLDFG